MSLPPTTTGDAVNGLFLQAMSSSNVKSSSLEAGPDVSYVAVHSTPNLLMEERS